MILFKVIGLQVLFIAICFALPNTKDENQGHPEGKTAIVREVKTNNQITKTDAKQTEELPVAVTRKRDIPDTMSDIPEIFNKKIDDTQISEDVQGRLLMNPSEDGGAANGQENYQLADLEQALGMQSTSDYDDIRIEDILKDTTDGETGTGLERRKRTAILQGLLNSPSSVRPKREVELTPDDVLALLALWEEQKQYKFPRTKWPGDNNLNSDEDRYEDEPTYNDGQGSHLYERRPIYWAVTGSGNEKRFMVSRKRRSSILSPPLKVPLYRRAVL